MTPYRGLWAAGIEVYHYHRTLEEYLAAFLAAGLRLTQRADVPDVAALAAPRPLLIQHGRRDPLYGVDEVETGFAVVRRAYAAAGVPERCAIDLFDGEHIFHPPAVERWFDRFL